MPEAVSAIRGVIAREFSQRYVAPFIREYKTKAKNAQEAHEAIRPTDVRAQARRTCAKYLEKDQARLYELIWKRTVASQMASAELEQTTADIEVKGRDGKTYGAARHRLGDHSSTASSRSTRKAATSACTPPRARTTSPPTRTTTAAACRRWRRATR